MPHVRIDLHRIHEPRLAAFSDAILEGMVGGLQMPRDDLYQIFRLHEPGELVFTTAYPYEGRDDIIFIELLASVGYTDEQKQAAMSQIADGFEALGIKRDNLMLVVAEVHGAAWYAPGTAAPVSKSMPGEV